MSTAAAWRIPEGVSVALPGIMKFQKSGHALVTEKTPVPLIRVPVRWLSTMNNHIADYGRPVILLLAGNTIFMLSHDHPP
jgi:hypothetical protein